MDPDVPDSNAVPTWDGLHMPDTEDIPQNQSQPLPILHDTPPKEKYAATKEYRSEHLESSRSAMLKDVGGIPIVSFELFKRFLPKPPSDTSKVKQQLLDQGDLTANGWKLWPKPPADLEAGENVVFKAFADLVNDIIDATKTAENGAVEPTVSQVNNPNYTPLSSRSNSSKPDGYLVLLPAIDGANSPEDSFRPYAKLMRELQLQTKVSTKRKSPPLKSNHVFWEDIGGAEEYKKGETKRDQADDQRKILWSLHHILRKDPCRRFAFGITVENKSVRVWLMHRAGALVSEAFSFMDDIDDLIYLVSSLAFASRTDLGWDSTIVPQLVVEGENARIAHRITIQTRDNTTEDYLTIGLISDFAANAIPGRGTRVFEVQKFGVQTPQAPCVLKDSWLDFDRPHEGDVMKELLDDLEKVEGLDKDEAKRHFLTVLCYPSVLVGGEVDSTLNTIMHGVEVPDGATVLQVPPFDLSEKSSRGSGTVGELPLIPEPIRKPRKLHHRVHHRIVFQERGEPLHEVQDLQVRLDALVDVARALGYLWRSRWLHRDISPGNILVFEGRGLLVDFEYTKKYVQGEMVHSVHEVRTGTSNYMAIEVHSQIYQFVVVDASRFPLKYNALHDIESHWWVTVWAIISRRVHNTTPGSYNVQRHRETFLRMYPRTSNEGRSMFMAWNNFRQAIVSNTFSAEFTEAMNQLDSLRLNLGEWYREAYKPLTRGEEANVTVFDSVHSPYLNSIQEIARKFRLIAPETTISLWED